MADQALLSVASLAVGLAMAREMAPADFGIYVIAFAVSLACASVQLSLVTDPLVILGSPRSGASQSGYFAALLKLQILTGLAVTAILGVVALLMHLAWGATSQLPVALASVACVQVPMQLQVFFRAIFFARLRPGAVLCNDLVYSALRVAGVVLLMASGRLSTPMAFMIAGAAALVASIVALPLIRDVLGARPDDLPRTWSAHWDYGRWLLATSGAYWCSGQAPALMASSILTPVAAAVIKACQYLVAPLAVAFSGLDGVLAPRASRLRASHGDAALARFLRLFAMAAAAGVAVYAAMLLPAAPAMMAFIYRGRYAGYTAIVGVLLLDALFTAIGRAPILRLKVSGDTRRIFIGYVWAAAGGLLSLMLLAPRFGVMGAACAAPVSSAVLLAYLTLWPRAVPSATDVAPVRAAAVSEFP